MIRAIAIKELRETIGIAVIGLLIYGAVIGLCLLQAIAARQSDQHRVPFITDGFGGLCGLVSIGLAIALGLRQSAWEGMRGTYLFLLHRPLARPAILVGKIVTGLALLQLIAALPLVAYGTWADLPGTHPTPFTWAMTTENWIIWTCLPVAYLGAFLTGLRPGWWRGTRLLPLFAALGLLFRFIELSWWTAALASAIASVILVVAIDCVADQRDFG